MPRQTSGFAPGETPLAELVAAISTGNEDALARLYDSTSSIVYGMALRVARETAAAEDIALDVFLQVWRTAGTYDASRTSVISWLAMMARSRAIDWLRSAQGRFVRSSEPLESMDHVDDSSPDPEHACVQSDRTRVIREGMRELPPEQRQVIELAFFGGLSHSEIAARLGQPLGTVKSRIRTGMLQLRESLVHYNEGRL